MVFHGLSVLIITSFMLTSAFTAQVGFIKAQSYADGECKTQPTATDSFRFLPIDNCFQSQALGDMHTHACKRTHANTRTQTHTRTHKYARKPTRARARARARTSQVLVLRSQCLFQRVSACPSRVRSLSTLKARTGSRSVASMKANDA